uniref:Protein TIFY n=1 Tax=Oryza punctata TaxID=4537 RepID=A0A0E0M792_ORYPU
MATADYRGYGGRSRFAVACGVLSRCVKATAAASSRHRPTMLLMPGADVVPDVREEAAQLKIMYGGRVLVFDNFAAGRAVELVRAAACAGREQADDARARRGGSRGLAAGLPVVRKGSLQSSGGRRRRFAVACGVLSRCVKAEAAAGKMLAAMAPSAANGHPAATAAAAGSTMLLMPGADVAPDVREEEVDEAAAAGAGSGTARQRLTIMYGGRVLVFDDFPAESAAEVVRVAARAGQEQQQDDDGDAHHGGGGGVATDLPVAREGSLQRFVEKKRPKLWATAPYSPRRSPPRSPFAANAGKDDGDAGRWLALGTPGSCQDARRGETSCHLDDDAAFD